jgi:hypothetical protein
MGCSGGLLLESVERAVAAKRRGKIARTDLAGTAAKQAAMG